MMNAQLLCKLVKDFVTQPIVGREILVHNVKRGSEMRSSLSSDCIMITEVIVQRKYSQRNQKLATIISCSHIKNIDF